MTVCIAALAANSTAIVCIADKALSYADYIQWDSDSSKMIDLAPSGSLVMFSGAEKGLSRVLAEMLETEGACGNGKKETRQWCESKYKTASEEIIQIEILNRRLLTRHDYVNAITAAQLNQYIQTIAEEVDKFDMGCDLLVCGFDFSSIAKVGNPFIFDLGHPGIATDMTHTGFHAIGSGCEKAISQMLWNDHKRTNPIEHVLYDVFDAKANAELAVGVGYEWDAKIIIGNNLCAYDVPKEIKQLLERAWSQCNRSPFDKYDPTEDLKPPPKNWKEKLRQFSESITRSASEKSEQKP